MHTEDGSHFTEVMSKWSGIEMFHDKNQFEEYPFVHPEEEI